MCGWVLDNHHQLAARVHHHGRPVKDAEKVAAWITFRNASLETAERRHQNQHHEKNVSAHGGECAAMIQAQSGVNRRGQATEGGQVLRNCPSDNPLRIFLRPDRGLAVALLFPGLARPGLSSTAPAGATERFTG